MEAELALLLSAQQPAEKLDQKLQLESGEGLRKTGKFLSSLIASLLSGEGGTSEEISGELQQMLQRAELTAKAADSALKLFTALLGEVGTSGKSDAFRQLLEELPEQQRTQLRQLVADLKSKPAGAVFNAIKELASELATQLQSGAQTLRPEGRSERLAAQARSAAETLSKQANQLRNLAAKAQQKAVQFSSEKVTLQQQQAVQKALREGVIDWVKTSTVDSGKQSRSSGPQMATSLERIQQAFLSRQRAAGENGTNSRAGESVEGRPAKPSGPSRSGGQVQLPTGNLLVNEENVRSEQAPRNASRQGSAAADSSSNSRRASQTIVRGMSGYRATPSSGSAGTSGSAGGNAGFGGEQGQAGTGGQMNPAFMQADLNRANSRAVQQARPQNIGEMLLREYNRLSRSKQRPAAKQLQIQLQPPELGKLNARLTLKDSGLHVRLQVENSQAHKALESQLPTLKQNLSMQHAEVEVELYREDGAGADSGGQQGENPDGEAEGDSAQNGEGLEGGLDLSETEEEDSGVNFFEDPDAHYI